MRNSREKSASSSRCEPCASASLMPRSWAEKGGFRPDLLQAVADLRPPVIRWPGGCFADGYHWRDGVGPRDKRPRSINAAWGNAPDSNAFGTHEFMDLCGQLGCEPYICGNVGSGTVRAASASAIFGSSIPHSRVSKFHRIARHR